MAPSGLAFISSFTTERCSSDVPGGVCEQQLRMDLISHSQNDNNNYNDYKSSFFCCAESVGNYLLGLKCAW